MTLLYRLLARLGLHHTPAPAPAPAPATPDAAAPVGGPTGVHALNTKDEVGEGTDRVPPFQVVGRQILCAGVPFKVAGANQGTWGKAQERDYAWLKARGCNTVRMPWLRWNGDWGHDGVGVDSRDDQSPVGFDPAYLDRSIQEAKWAVAAGLKIWGFIDSNFGQSSIQDGQTTLDLANALKYTHDPAYPPSAFTVAGGGRNFITDPPTRARYWNVWRVVMQRLKDENLLQHCVALELQPEMLADQWAPQWLAGLQMFYREGHGVIREFSRYKPVVMGGQAYRSGQLEEVYAGLSDLDGVIWTADLFMHVNTVTPDGSGAHSPNIAQWTKNADILKNFGITHNVPAISQQCAVETKTDTLAHDGLKAIIAHQRECDGCIQWQVRQNNDDNVPQAFDSYGLIITHKADGSDIFKLDEIALWQSLWMAGTQLTN
jgi:hypothetical protein